MFNQKKCFPYDSCLAYKLSPAIYAVRIIGFEFQKSCQCIKKRNSFVDDIFVIYTHILEIFLWVAGFLRTIFNNWKIPCEKSIDIFGNFKNYAHFTLLCISLYIALQYSILKRRKIYFHYEMNIYKEENKFIDKLENILLAFLSLLCFLLIVISVVNTLIYSHLKNEECSDLEALFCSIFIQLYLFYVISHIIAVLCFAVLSLLIMGKRLIELSKQSQIKIITDAEFLQDMMEKHIEIREFFEDVNENFKMLLPLIYIHFVYLACFLLYGAIFFDKNSIIRYVIAIFALIVLFGCLATARTLSMLTSLIYDTFIAIGKCALMPFPIVYRFKIIDFMKRFGGMPMGISVAGFFFVKKNFFIRMVSGLYSVFSTLLQLTGVMAKNKCFLRIHKKLNESMSTN